LVGYNDLKRIREDNKDKKVGFCSGCFDILHSGHITFFRQCKELGDILVVGLGPDKIIRELKGQDRPINPENNRAYLLSAIQDVDHIILADESLAPGKIHFTNLLEKLNPNIFVLNDDDSALKEKKILADRLGIDLKLVSRTVPDYLEKTSSTEIINKIRKIIAKI
jgi:D-beta-D-heptose 7-phosphate kinase/D-beta-D-heptose 1-phosphate adenosyltransferase